MKNTASLLLTLVALAAVPIFAHAGDDVKADNKASKKVAKVAKQHKDITYYYITNQTIAGSNIPLVVRVHGNNIESSAPVTAYKRYDLDRTGGEDVGGELLAIDPAISLVRR